MPENNKEQGEEPDQFINFKIPVLKLSKLFNTKKFELIIPDYQRDYAWPEDFVLTLLDDIKKSLVKKLLSHWSADLAFREGGGL